MEKLQLILSKNRTSKSLVEIDNRSLKSEHKRVGQCYSKKEHKSWYNVVSRHGKCVSNGQLLGLSNFELKKK